MIKTSLKALPIYNCYECPNSINFKVLNKDTDKVFRMCRITRHLTDAFDSDFYTTDHWQNWFPLDCPLDFYGGDRRIKLYIIKTCRECTEICIDGHNDYICGITFQKLDNELYNLEIDSKCCLKNYKI